MTASPSLTKSPFLLTRLLRGATKDFYKLFSGCDISTHTPLARRDRRRAGLVRIDSEFLLTRPMRGATDAVTTQHLKEADFYSHAPCGARLRIVRNPTTPAEFLLTRLLRGATQTERMKRPSWMISTHTPLARRDERNVKRNFERFQFLLTRLLRGATAFQPAGTMSWTFLLTRLLRGATYTLTSSAEDHAISTHTPLARRDRKDDDDAQEGDISTHTPLARRDLSLMCTSPLCSNFYSHAPCGARLSFPLHTSCPSDFYSHAPCGARHSNGMNMLEIANFYSHAPCGARPMYVLEPDFRYQFLLTRPMRGATVIFLPFPPSGRISTHTPLARRDENRGTESLLDQNFYSHASCEARQRVLIINLTCLTFLLTRLLRGATV